MAVTYATAAKTARMTATRDAVADGTLEIGTSAMGSVLATFGLSASAGTVAGTVWTLAFDNLTVTATAAGTVAAAQIKNASGTVLISGLTVGTSGTDIIVNNTTIALSASVTLSSGTITHA